MNSWKGEPREKVSETLVRDRKCLIASATVPGHDASCAEHAGEDGLSQRCRIVVLAVRRQATADAGVPAQQQGAALRLLPQGRGSPRRVSPGCDLMSEIRV